MKSIFLVAVVVCALAIAGIGGTFATWSDSETSMGNKIVTGSVDLKVNGEDDVGPSPDNPKWGNGVPTKVSIDCMIPCQWYGPFEVDLWNAGVCEYDSKCYVHFKDACCGNAPPKEGSGYEAPGGEGMKPEPELVAEYGGKVDCLYVPGIGVTGDNCSMLSHVEVIVCDADGNVLVGPSKLVDILCDEIYICDLTPCQQETIYMYFHLIQESEEDYGYDFFADPGDAGFDELRWKKFNDWPSWAMMRDQVVFSVEFDLLLDVPADELPCLPGE